MVASKFDQSVRELEGALVRVVAWSELTGQQVSVELAERALQDLLPQTEHEIPPQLILEETAKMFGWTIEDLCGKSRRRPLVTARQIGMYVMRELTDLSYPRSRRVRRCDHDRHVRSREDQATMNERHTVDQVTELIARIKLGTGG
jgi:chromosomal replication initiator protein